MLNLLLNHTSHKIVQVSRPLHGDNSQPTNLQTYAPALPSRERRPSCRLPDSLAACSHRACHCVRQSVSNGLRKFTLDADRREPLVPCGLLQWCWIRHGPGYHPRSIRRRRPCQALWRSTFSTIHPDHKNMEQAQCLLNMMKFWTSPLAVPTQRSAKMAASASLHSTT